MNISEGFRIAILTIVMIAMPVVTAPIIIALSGASLIAANFVWIGMIIGSYYMGRVLAEQLIRDNQ